MIHHITRATRHLIFWSLIVTALGMTSVRLVLTSVEGYKARLAARVGMMVGAPVKIGKLGARMRGFSPEIVLNDIDIASVTARRQNAIELKEIRLGIHLLQAVLKRELLASSWVTLVGAKLTVKRNSDGKLSIAGLNASEGNPLWLLETGKYEVIDSDITWQDAQRRGRPLTFESADLALINENEHHRINVLMRLPEKFGKSLRVSLDFTGDMFDLKSLQGRAYIEGKSLNLPEWVTLDLPLAITLASGRGDLNIWSDWQQEQATAVAGQVKIHDLKLKQPGLGAFAAGQLQSRFQLKLSEKHWRLDIDEFRLTTQNGGEIKIWPDAVFSVKGAGDAEKAMRQIALYAERLDIQEAALLGRFLLPPDDVTGQFLRDTGLKGELRDFSLFADTDQQSLSVNGGFSHVGIAASDRLPGFENLSGRIQGNRGRGTLVIASDDAVFRAPDLFRQPLPLDRVHGIVQWLQTDDAWSVDSPLLMLESQGLNVQTRLHLAVPNADGSLPFIDLQGVFSCADMKAVSRYLPARIMRPDVVDWLDHAFVQGNVPKGRLLLHGNPADFPFTDTNGVFEAIFDTENMELAYLPDWPNLTGASAEVVFNQDGLKAAVRQGSSYGVTVNKVDVDIPHLNATANLQVNGKLEGKISQALEFVQNSPLAARADALLQVATPQGNAKIDLDLQIPMRQGGQYKTDVTAHFENAELRLKSPDLPVRQVRGRIKFDDKGMYGENLGADMLNHPVKVSLETVDQQTRLNVDGRVDIGDLRAQFGMPWLDFAQGETAYQLALRLPHPEGRLILSIRSDLDGVQLDLPDMLAKPAKQRRSLMLAFDLTDKNILPVELSYGDDFSAALKIDLNKQLIESGHVLLGAGKAEQRSEPGLKLEINREKLQLEDWIKMAGAETSEHGAKVEIRQLNVHGDQGFWQQAELGPFNLNLQRAGTFWEGRIDSPILNGRVKLPADLSGLDRIDLKLDRLDVSALANIKMEKGGRDGVSDYFPLLSVTSEKTFWKEVDLGRFAMNTERIPGGLLFDRFVLQGKDQKLTLTGDWKITGGNSQTQAKGRLELINGGELFDRLGISKDLTDTSGVVDFGLNWQAPPYRFALADLQGFADVDFKSGRILSIEPGFGRVLGILAMAQWLKRLQLDFSDVYQEGLTFNSIKGRFNLGNGKAVTDDLIVDAVPAKISISGQTDFVNRTVDHIVNVAPKSADAVPIAGTIMGKFAALIDKTITGTEHEGFFFGSQYLVKGGWGNAEIHAIHEREGLLQKTWSGITDFPSLLKNKK
ncbi:YhdP family protein [Methylomicrobium sp. Wu6]|uniref:YhdP family protein n=1 Tax=Methylomicrobium sp. Wu6 TaxID=3107928 RepID=UPI002DD63862|nr:YhdP family protein [Methylomicrobium sp. Wu6]MEC4748332.1 YhdP family protein [Methylomicrobium sp. Wu6]